MAPNHGGPVKVLYVVDGLGHGGAERRCLLLAEAAVRAGYRVRVVPVFRAEHEYPVPDGVELGRGLTGPNTPGRRYRLLWREMRDFRPDVYHGFLGTGTLGAVVARAAGVPVRVISLVTGMFEDYAPPTAERLKARLALACASVGQANSRRVYRFYRDAWRIPERNLVNIPNFIDADRVPCRDNALRAEVRDELGLADDEFVFATVARLDAYKGHDDLLHAAADISADCPKARWVFIGDGPNRAEFEELSEQLQLSGRARFLGLRDDVLRLLQGMDGFILPSLFEGMPNALLEAMAAGLPAIGTRVAGSEELIVPGRTGWLVDIRDRAGLAVAMRECVADPAQSIQMGLAGRRRIEQEYHQPVVIERFFQLYRELAARRPRPS